VNPKRTKGLGVENVANFLNLHEQFLTPASVCRKSGTRVSWPHDVEHRSARIPVQRVVSTTRSSRPSGIVKRTRCV
jgi:hypothetical protein